MARASARYELRAQDKTRGAFASFRRRIGRSTKALHGMTGALAGVLSAGGLIAGFKALANKADRIQKLALQTGATTETISELGFAAKITGTNLETVIKGIQNLQKNTAEAARGSKTYVDLLGKLNIDVGRFAKLRPGRQIEVFADAFVKLKSPTEKTQVAMLLLGRAGKDMVPVLNLGATGIRLLRNEAAALGGSVSSKLAGDMAQFNDQLERLKVVLTGVGFEIASGLIGPLTELVDVIRFQLKPVVQAVAKSFQVTGGTAGGVFAGLKEISFGSNPRLASPISPVTILPSLVERAVRGTLVGEVKAGASVLSEAIGNLTDYLNGTGGTPTTATTRARGETLKGFISGFGGRQLITVNDPTTAELLRQVVNKLDGRFNPGAPIVSVR